MRCKCGAATAVIETRRDDSGSPVRTRKCGECGVRFHTIEIECELQDRRAAPRARGVTGELPRRVVDKPPIVKGVMKTPQERRRTARHAVEDRRSALDDEL